MDELVLAHIVENGSDLMDQIISDSNHNRESVYGVIKQILGNNCDTSTLKGKQISIYENSIVPFFDYRCSGLEFYDCDEILQDSELMYPHIESDTYLCTLCQSLYDQRKNE